MSSAISTGKKAGEFYTPQRISDILSSIVILDSQDPNKGEKKKLNKVLDFACGSGSLLLNVRRKMYKAGGSIGKYQFYLPEIFNVEIQTETA